MILEQNEEGRFPVSTGHSLETGIPLERTRYDFPLGPRQRTLVLWPLGDYRPWKHQRRETLPE